MMPPARSPLTRRLVLAGLPASLAIAGHAQAGHAQAGHAQAGHAQDGADELAGLERSQGGQLGVLALETGSGRVLAHRADERFLMCSTFKLLLAAAVLARVDAGQERLDRPVRYGAPDLLDYAPVTRAHVGQGTLDVATLCAAVVELSDNTAANLLLASVGGPPGVTRFARRLGDRTTRLDRMELALNTPSGLLDTTTPRAMAGTVRAVLLGEVLGASSRATLEGWMVACNTGRHRLRAGLPTAWPAGDKTGTGHSQTNDLALIRPPGRAPLVVAAYYEGGPPGSDAREAVLRSVGAIMARWAA